MKSITIYGLLNPTTSNGYAIKISTTYSSFDEKEIEDLHKELREIIGSGVVMDYQSKVRGEEE